MRPPPDATPPRAFYRALALAILLSLPVWAIAWRLTH